MARSPERPLSILPSEPGNSSSPDLSTSDSSFLTREERRDFLGGLRQQGMIESYGSPDQEIRTQERELARKELAPLERVSGFIQSTLTPKGEKILQEATDIGDSSLIPPEQIIEIFKAHFSPQKDLIPIDEDLKEAWGKGPSSIIAGQIKQQLDKAMGRTEAGKVPLGAWLFNPAATLKVARATAAEATARAGVRKTVSETAQWLAEVAEDDTKRDILLNHTESLEETLSQYVEPFCKARGIPVPEKATFERMVILLKINADMVILHARAGEITRNEEELVIERERIQGEAARNQMIVLEKPEAIETRKEVNGLREKEVAETATHWTTLILGIPAAATVGSPPRILGMMIEAGKNSVAEHPLVAIPLGTGVMFFGTLSAKALFSGMFLESLGPIALSSAVVTGVVAMGTFVSAGLTKWMGKKREETREGTEYAILK